MARSGDFDAHRREVFAHYLNVARFDRAYALDAIARAEAASEGVLAGITEELRAVLTQLTTTTPPTGRRKPNVPA